MAGTKDVGRLVEQNDHLQRHDVNHERELISRGAPKEVGRDVEHYGQAA
jgi:hypothetical protein